MNKINRILGGAYSSEKDRIAIRAGDVESTSLDCAIDGLSIRTLQLVPMMSIVGVSPGDALGDIPAFPNFKSALAFKKNVIEFVREFCERAFDVTRQLPSGAGLSVPRSYWLAPPMSCFPINISFCDDQNGITLRGDCDSSGIVPGIVFRQQRHSAMPTLENVRWHTTRYLFSLSAGVAQHRMVQSKEFQESLRRRCSMTDLPERLWEIGREVIIDFASMCSGLDTSLLGAISKEHHPCHELASRLRMNPFPVSFCVSAQSLPQSYGDCPDDQLAQTLVKLVRGMEIYTSKRYRTFWDQMTSAAERPCTLRSRLSSQIARQCTEANCITPRRFTTPNSDRRIIDRSAI